MTPTRMLHLLLVLALVMFLIIIVKTTLHENETVRWAPLPATLAPQNPLTPAKPHAHRPDVIAQIPGRWTFPAPFDRYYVAMPVLWEKKPLEGDLAKGDIQTPPAPNKTPQAKPIAPAPTVVKLPWVFALP